MKQKILFLLISLFSIWSLSAQDLIESTIKGLKKKEQSKTNVIAKSVLNKRSFDSSSLFTYEGNDLDLGDEKYLDQVIRIKLDLSSLQSLKKKKSNTLRLSIPVSKNQSFHLLMEKVDILEPDYYMETSDGRIIYPDRNKIAFYRGIVEGNTNSMVSLTIVDKEVKLLISDDEGNYSINKDEKRKGIWNLYNEKKLKVKSDFKCGTHDGMRIGDSVNPNKGTSTKMAKNVPVYIEVENDIYLAKGSNMAMVQSHIMALMNASVTAFANEQINISLSTIKIWDNGMSPYRKNDLGNTLTDFGANIKDTYNGRLAHYLSSAAINGGTVGIAWVDVLCATYEPNQSSGPYGISADINSAVLPSYAANSVEVLTFVHELGHNFGSPHTHSCSWGTGNNLAIDDCAAQDNGPCGVVAPVTDAIRGTIMSYCNNANLNKGFGTEPGALILGRYNAATCIDDAGGGDDCPANLTVSTATTTGNSLASASVSTTGMVAVSGASVFSSNNINLNAGFEVPSGNCFEANNVGCTYTGVLTCDGGGGATCTDYTSADGAQAIPDQTSVVSTIIVGDTKTITEVEIINITGNHMYMGDLLITLKSPDNTTITVKTLDGSFNCDSNFNITLDDDAATTALDCNSINPGTYKPSSDLSGFDGKTSNGTWILTVLDQGEGDTGNLSGWTLRVCGTPPGFTNPGKPLSN
ncbi:MAG: subtilisin-like proprotein convertase family protein [Saprospiraceae bacterium]|jgi:subtilisin-like proprotein convertase family protein